jgi:hypothetical protein
METTTTAPVLANWIPDRNKFKLPEPPAWALKRLYDFDHQLVVIPSRKDRNYLLCRRRHLSAGIGDVAMVDNKHPDTNMMISLGVLPVSEIVSKSGAFQWSDESVTAIILNLKARDTWALTGGPDGDPNKAWKAVEEAEAAERRKRKAALKDKFYHMGRDAWRSLTARVGSRNKRASDYHGHARPSKGGTLQINDRRRVKAEPSDAAR